MKIILIFYAILILVSILHVVSIILKKETLRRISKCLIVPVLLAVYIAGGGNKYLFPIPALILGWIGDVLLIKIEKKIHFILGLASFLLGHLCYILTFIQILGFFGSGGTAGTIHIPAVLLLIPPMIVLGIIVFRLVKPPKELYIPVVIYIYTLVAMTLFGFQVFLFNPNFAGLLILSGCLCFMISDTILAYYTFRKLKISGAVFIMAYYILAQTEIVLGILLLKTGALC